MTLTLTQAEAVVKLRRVKFGVSRKSALAAAVEAIAIVDGLRDDVLTRSDSYAQLHSSLMGFDAEADVESFGTFAENRTDAQYAVASLAEAIVANANATAAWNRYVEAANQCRKAKGHRQRIKAKAALRQALNELGVNDVVRED